MRDFPVSVSSPAGAALRAGVSTKDDTARRRGARKKFSAGLTVAASLLLAALILSSLQISSPRAAEFEFISAEISKREKIRDLIKLSGMEAMISQMIPNAVTRQFALVGSLRKDIPKSLLSNLADQTTLEMLASKQNFLEALVPVYDRHMTDGEISALLEIYKNPALAGILKKLPALTYDSRKVAKYWGQAVSNKVFRHLSNKLIHKGYKI